MVHRQGRILGGELVARTQDLTQRVSSSDLSLCWIAWHDSASTCGSLLGDRQVH